jgi:membrane-bound inhibitor of C-type lysozyme
VNVETIADGKVYSSALIPFLFGSKKIINSDKMPGFLVHKVKMPHEGVELSNIDKIKSDIEKYTEELEDIYRSTGVSEEAIKHLAGGNDLLIEDYDRMVKYGLADEFIGENKKNLINTFKNMWRNPKKEAKFSFQNKFEDSEDLNNKKQINNKKTMDEETNKLINSMSAALNKYGEMIGNMDARMQAMDEKYNAMSRMQPSQDEEITDKEFMNLKNEFRKTSVLNHGKVKNVLHLKNKCNEGDWMMPMNAAFEVEEEEEIEEECLNLANGGKFMNSKKKAINKVEPAPIETPKNVGADASALINSLTDETAPNTKVQNIGKKTDGNDIGSLAKMIQSSGGKYASGVHVFQK